METGKMYCKYCGSIIDADALICPIYGKQLRQPIAAPAIPQSSTQSAVQYAYQNQQGQYAQQHFSNMHQAQPIQGQFSQYRRAANGQPIYIQQPPQQITINITQESSRTNLVSRKSKAVTLALCVFLGGLGAHHFYAERYGMWLLYINTMGLFGIGWVVDIIQILTDNYKDNEGRYIMV